MKSPSLIGFRPRLFLRKRGFALVVTLSLMILLTIVAVGLLSLSSIALRGSSQGAAMQLAQANARLALMMAVSQLQQWSGPDQRVTAAADQRPKSSDGQESSAHQANRYWTGVYRSWSDPDPKSNRPQPELLGWMVSGDPQKLGNQDLPDAAAANAVELVGKGTALANSVRAPLVEIRNSSASGAKAVGKMAWWVGDQGLKAAVATPPMNAENSMGLVRNNLQGAPRNAVQIANSGTKRPFEKLEQDDSRIGLVTSWKQSEFLASGAEDLKPLFHDLAPFSTGMLTNVVTGGFRKDLSMRLESGYSSTPTNEPNAVNTALYTVGGEPGVNLNELWAYYNAYKEVRRSGSFNYTTSGKLASGTRHVLVAASPTDCSNDYEFHLKQPTIISYQMVLSFITRAVSVGGATKNRLYVVTDPILTLWNPLDVPVAIPTSSYISVKYWQIPYNINVRVNGGAPLQAPLAASLSGATTGDNKDANFMSVQIGTSSGGQIVLKPGEVVKFSKSDGIQYFDDNNARHTLVARKGFNYNGGFGMPLRDLNGKTIDINPTDTITYEAQPNPYTAGKTGTSGATYTGANQHSRHFSTTHHEVYVGADRGQLPNSLGYGNIAIDWDFGNKRVLTPAQIRGGTTAESPPGTKPAGERLAANKFPDIFRPVSGSNTRPISAAQLQSGKSPFLLLSFDAKTETGSLSQTRSFPRFNPKAHHVDFYTLKADERDMLSYEFSAEPMTTWVNRSLDISPDGSGFFGGGLTGEYGTRQVITHSYPCEAPVSLAAFQHSFANGFTIQKPINGYATLNAREPMLPQVSHAIGNSLAPSVLASDKVEGTLPGGRPMADHSYLANRALWDDYFLSGIAPQYRDSFGGTVDVRQRKVAEDFFTDDVSNYKSLPVVRYLPHKAGLKSSEILPRIFASSSATSLPKVDAAELVASFIRVDGLFNVNSTSVEAWKAVLGSLKGRPVVVRDQNGQESIETPPAGGSPGSLKHPVVGLRAPRELIAKGSGGISINDPSQWVGRRELTDDEITRLAEVLVREVRKRGPFLNLADFVNRRVGSDKELARAGALQAALESAQAGINENFISGDRVVGGAASRLAFSEAEKGPISHGIPGIVKQADVLTPIAPVLSARSDSFIVRAYGEALDGNGKPIATAWCEAVVERDMNYVDSAADSPEDLPTSLNAVNTKFGRRYEIISFRWLSASEV